MFLFKYLCYGAILLSSAFQIVAADCSINARTLKQNHPLFLTLHTNEIIYPEMGSSILHFGRNEQFELDCPGLGVIQADGIKFGRTVKATCVRGEIINIERRNVDVRNIVCSRRILSIARYTSNLCGRKYWEIEVGFVLPMGKFVLLLTSCFDHITRNVVYTRFHLKKEIGSRTTGNTRPGWIEGSFYNLSIRLDTLYTNAIQRSTINRQIGLSDTDVTYVKPTGNYYLARGHLVARSDFYFNAEQQATFYYINSVPQWQTFNALNWFYAERNLRNFASKNELDLDVYTGTYGISKLPHASTGEDVRLYFYKETGDAMPIPELFWKVAYDPANKAGVAVLGINNPYQTDIKRSEICDDISAKISWLNFNIHNIQAGYMYACNVDDLRKVIRDIPRLAIKKLLT